MSRILWVRGMKKKENQTKKLYTDLILEQDLEREDEKKRTEYRGITVTNSLYKKNHYTTISYQNILDRPHQYQVIEIFTKELKKYLKPRKDDIFLIVGLGNEKSTPDSLGPLTIDKVLVTRYLFLLGEVEEGYGNVCSFTPSVMGNTGIETSDMIKRIIEEVKATKVVLIDALKTNDIKRLTKTIQITDQGISPGSGVQNSRKEISKKTTGVDVIAIGVPTVVDIETILENTTKKKMSIPENLMVTPTDIDFIVERLSEILSKGINLSIHQKRNTTK